MRPIEPFDPATMPLDGIRLVEASAGTGKTFSLAGLYLRLIVEQHLDVREILVMTFTRAATQELRERLRERLARAARIAAEPPDPARPDPADALSETVIAAAGEDRDAVAARLREAATRVDQATITTIHGFAQKAAAENAFESALPFDRGEQVDDAELWQEATTDYWRGQVFGRDARTAAAFVQLWPAPESLFKTIGEVLRRPHARLVEPDLERLERDRQAGLGQWRWEREALRELLEQAVEANGFRQTQSDNYGNSLRVQLETDGIDAWLERIEEGLAGTAEGLPGLPPIVADLAHDGGLDKHVPKATAKWFRPQDLPLVQRLGSLQVQGRLACAAVALRRVRERTAALKRERRLYSFDDMIAGLHAAVTDEQQGLALATALRRTWPWALVDEFQDTDPTQYGILRRIYQTPGEDPRGLLLIGDPKQAIYGFRGGDVFAYLEAGADAAGRYGMDTNFRSTRAVLDGLGALFTAGGERAFVLDGIDFRPVRPGRSEGDRVLACDGDELPGVTAWAIPGEVGTEKNKVAPALAAATVGRIAELLDGGAFTGRESRPLQPRDIAVLVNSNREAMEMQRQLGAAGVPAVCIHQDSVFATDEAHHLLRLLRAAAVPFDRDRLRVALGTPLFGFRLGDLVALDGDEPGWTRWSEHFQQGHLQWARSGVLALVEPFVQAAAARLAGLPDGERRLTNYLHLAERLQEAEHEVFGMEGLVRWLEDAHRRASEDGEVTEADRLRLENDSDLVQVTTVHKAKGLQFPVVFVPYAPWLGTGGDKPTQPPYHFHDGDNRAVIDLGSVDADAHRPQALRERRAEQVRSLYVALTRAEQACFFSWGAVKGALDSPLAWLLHQDDGAELEQWHGGAKPPGWFDAGLAEARLRAVATASGGSLQVRPLPGDGGGQAPVRARAAAPLGPARSDFPAPRPPWSMFSFTRLAGRMTRVVEAAAGADDVDEGTAVAAGVEAEIPLHPRGAGFGQAFHELLEAIDFATWPAPGAPLSDAQRLAVGQALRRHGVATHDERGRPLPLERTAALIGNALHTGLPEIGPLAAVPAGRRRAEIEFFLRLGGSRGHALMRLLEHGGYGDGTGIEETVLRGLMQGFIDLVVEAGGRYWVVDYKTNALGPLRRDYGPDRLAESVRQHHYDLQYLIYTVALHRYLRARLEGYEPATHLGGVQYLFVRGMQPGDAVTGIHLDRPAVELVERLDALFDAEGVAA